MHGTQQHHETISVRQNFMVIQKTGGAGQGQLQYRLIQSMILP